MSESSLVQIKLLKHPEGFTGKFGNYNFTNNISEPMLRREAERLSVITSVEFIDSENIIERRQRERGEVHQIMESKKVAKVAPQAPVSAPEKPKYDRPTLESIADKEGSAGLRKIANEYNVKGRSIPELIEAIMKAQ